MNTLVIGSPLHGLRFPVASPKRGVRAGGHDEVAAERTSQAGRAASDQYAFDRLHVRTFRAGRAVGTRPDAAAPMGATPPEG